MVEKVSENDSLGPKGLGLSEKEAAQTEPALPDWDPVARARTKRLLALNKEIAFLSDQIFNAFNPTKDIGALSDFERVKCIKDIPVREVRICESVPFVTLKSTKEKIKQAAQYLHEAESLPLSAILSLSSSPIFPRDALEAERETKRVKLLKKVNRLREKNKLVIKESLASQVLFQFRWMANFHEFRRECLKRVCLELHAFFEDNIIDCGDTVVRRVFRSVYLEKRALVSVPAACSKRFVPQLIKFRGNYSKAKFATTLPKKPTNTCHSSHLNALSKVPPELSKIADPVGIMEFLKRAREKNRMYGGIYLRPPSEAPHPGYQSVSGHSSGAYSEVTRGPITTNVSFNVNREPAQRQYK